MREVHGAGQVRLSSVSLGGLEVHAGDVARHASLRESLQERLEAHTAKRSGQTAMIPWTIPSTPRHRAPRILSSVVRIRLRLRNSRACAAGSIVLPLAASSTWERSCPTVRTGQSRKAPLVARRRAEAYKCWLASVSRRCLLCSSWPWERPRLALRRTRGSQAQSRLVCQPGTAPTSSWVARRGSSRWGPLAGLKARI